MHYNAIANVGTGLRRKVVDVPLPRVDPSYYDDIIKAYSSGQSEKSVASDYGVSRGAIRYVLSKNSVPIRGRSDSMLVRMSRLTPEERKANALAANAAKRGLPNTDAQQRRVALTNYHTGRRIGRWEKELTHELVSRGLSADPQFPVDRYNVDIAIPPIAVEVHTQYARPYYHLRDRNRIKYLCDTGWTMVYVLAGRTMNIPLVADEIVTFREEVQRDPSLVGEYRMIRGSGEFLAFSRADLDQIP